MAAINPSDLLGKNLLACPTIEHFHLSLFVVLCDIFAEYEEGLCTSFKVIQIGRGCFAVTTDYNELICAFDFEENTLKDAIKEVYELFITEAELSLYFEDAIINEDGIEVIVSRFN